jgi:hypothetical protein
MATTLSPAQISDFIENGFLKIESGFPAEVAHEWAGTAFDRLGIDADDKSTWNVDRVHMPGSRSVGVAEFAPKVWAAACELCGGEDRVVSPWKWGNGFIVNLGERSSEPWQAASAECPGWHKDGDFFLHFLDSPEQGLLTLVLWTDVVHQGGPTYLAADSVGVIARYMANHPEGVEPNGFDFKARIRECERFTEATGKAGDVYLIHPYAMHAVSQNILRVARIITNPPITLREPMQFDRPDGAYSPVERAVLAGLGVERYSFTPAAERRKIIPGRLVEQARLAAEEAARAAARAS